MGLWKQNWAKIEDFLKAQVLESKMSAFKQRMEVGKDNKAKVQKAGRLSKQQQIHIVLGNCCDQNRGIDGLSRPALMSYRHRGCLGRVL